MGRIPRGSRGVGDPEVATRLDPGERYRIWWFNRRRVVRTQVSENGENGRCYRKRSTTAYKPREEWIAVPVPDYGIICGLAPEARPDPLYRAPDIYHASPYDTYYCITVGVWNPLLERTRFFERIERLLRRFTAGTDPASASRGKGTSTSSELPSPRLPRDAETSAKVIRLALHRRFVS